MPTGPPRRRGGPSPSSGPTPARPRSSPAASSSARVGYYDYDNGFTPAFEGEANFAGTIVHPQHWPEDLDYAGKRVVVIGSGATAITLIPAMAGTAEHVTMLQRSPSYVLPLPGKDPIANGLQRVLGPERAYRITRGMNIARQRFIYGVSQRHPRQVRSVIRAVDQAPSSRRVFDVDTHFKPKYDPWDQRLCAVPDGDLFKAIRKGQASVVTDRIERFTERGIRLESGRDARGRHRRHRDRAEPARLRRHRADGRRRRRSSSATSRRLQEHDAQRGPELRVRDRLHERLLDAEGRPRLRAPLPACSPTWTSTATTRSSPSPTTRRSSGGPLLDFTRRLRAARDRRASPSRAPTARGRSR